MHIYRCDLTLMEALFFSSREVSDLYQTEPLIGNYALAYALKFCQSGYHNDGTIHYGRDLGGLNGRGIYVTPATFNPESRFILRTFNAQTDGHWSAYGAGVIVARSAIGWSKKEGQHWYQVEEGGRERRQNATNRPQIGRLRLLAPENKAVFFILSADPLSIPKYIRLGKFMSKARLIVQEVDHTLFEAERGEIRLLLNPADIPAAYRLNVFDMVNVPPTPLIRNIEMGGRFYRLADTDRTILPQGMQFNIDGA